MIYELRKEEFSKVMPLLRGDFINLEIKAVVEGYNPGWVFVDDIENPQTSMVWSRGIEGFYFVGDENNPKFNDYINNFIDKEIYPRAKELGLNSFEFSGTSKEWDNTLRSIFENRNIEISKQFVYKHKNLQDTIFDHIPLEEGYNLRKVDEDLLNNNKYDLEYVKEAIYEWWDSIEDFIKYGVGYCILHNNTAVCSCVTSFMIEDSMESHIKTKEEHRKKALQLKL
ncbi:GNAT family N-acetyltransferase [Clostridium sp. D2Q-11]|uniref:GNAT family N-acetyltransferase n=1 Tax=Anaeromonas frigoriresistens TaxID=2683708 RepID=A0A942UWE6_9FIRM|nr:GNAT family N-acetyltransferase [Anaeromonas frigoriresistens]MBS4538780.1 GNAT family N-acetyltransferase [Anaeromonas frigoriresistens]